MNEATPTDAPTEKAPDPAATMRRICCIAAPRRATPSIADQMRAVAVWAQIFQGARAAQDQEQQEPDESAGAGQAARAE